MTNIFNIETKEEKRFKLQAEANGSNAIGEFLEVRNDTCKEWDWKDLA